LVIGRGLYQLPTLNAQTRGTGGDYWSCVKADGAGPVMA
jgi:hypothetical protein